MEYVVYSKVPGECRYCDRVKAFLSGIHVPFTVREQPTRAEIDAVYDRLGLQGGQRTMPQVVIERDGQIDRRVGGWRETLTAGLGSLWRQHSKQAG